MIGRPGLSEKLFGGRDLKKVLASCMFLKVYVISLKRILRNNITFVYWKQIRSLLRTNISKYDPNLFSEHTHKLFVKHVHTAVFIKQ